MRTRVQIQFSEPVSASASTIQGQLRTTNATVRAFRKVGSNAAEWEAELSFESSPPDKAMTLTLEAAEGQCTDAGVICNASNDKALTENASISIIGPPLISIADATAAENTDATIDFTVTLSRAMTNAVGTKWITTDSRFNNRWTATQGEDFIGVLGTITFLPGETTKTLSLEIIDDGVDEGDETFEVTLWDFQGVYNASEGDKRAVGTITNDDPMPRAWLARFGRAVGSQAAQAVSDRMDAQQGDETQVTIGGMGIDLEDDETLTPALETLWSEEQRRGREEPEREMTLAEVLQSSAFSMRREDPNGGGGWSVWARAMHEDFEGREADVDVKGEVNSAVAGADITRGRWTAGLALSQSAGDGTFSMHAPAEGERDDKRERGGEVTSTLSAVYPYVGYRWKEATNAWAMAGAGTGEMDITRGAAEETETARTITTDIEMEMVAAGTKLPWKLQSAGDALDLSIRADALHVRMSSDRSEGMESAKTRTTRLRLMLGGGHTFEIGAGTLKPEFEIGMRHDSGDAENGLGIETGGQIEYRHGRVALEARARTLLGHEDASYREWGASVGLRIEPAENGLGLSLRIAPQWGEAAGDAEQVWEASRPRGLGTPSEKDTGRVEAEIGYDLANRWGTLGGVVTPYLGASLGEGGNSTWRTGARWQIAPEMTLGLEASRGSGATAGVKMS